MKSCFTVSVRGLPPSAAQIYSGDVAEALHQLGLRAGVGTGGTDRIEVQVEETCENRLGVCCRWQANAQLTSAGALPQEIALQPRDAAGCDRADADAARDKLLRAVRPSDLAFRLRAPLSVLLPLARIIHGTTSRGAQDRSREGQAQRRGPQAYLQYVEG